MRRLPGPAGPLAVEEHGQGPLPLVLIHGMAGDASFWSSMVRALGAGHRVIIPELRGHGRSAQPSDGQYAIGAHAADLVAVVEGMGLDRVVLVGHSFGASVALEAATLMPTRVAGMLLLDAAGDFSYVPPEALDGFIAGMEHPAHYTETVEGAFDVALEGATADTERRVRAAIMAAPPVMIVAMYKSLLRYKPTDALARYSGPLLLVTAPSNSASFALHELCPEVPRRHIEGVSHWMMMDHPKAVARLVEEFVHGL
ncbi:MAG: alpha/beta hydrolase [Gemmatimonadales bacterium]|nr:alpha/beta hydrolase [Gemmatimonadales bacterium]